METAATASSSAVTAPSGGTPLKKLQEFEQEHQLDPNLPLEEVNAVEAVLEAANAEEAKKLETDLGENSPYPEVRLVPPIFRPRSNSEGNRSARLSGTMMSTSPRTRSEPG